MQTEQFLLSWSTEAYRSGQVLTGYPICQAKQSRQQQNKALSLSHRIPLAIRPHKEAQANNKTIQVWGY